MSGSLLGPSSRVQDRLGSRPMSLRTRGRAHRFEHRRAHDRVRELERVLVAEEVEPERARWPPSAPSSGRSRRARRREQARCDRRGSPPHASRSVASGGRRARRVETPCETRSRAELEHMRRVLDRRSEPSLQTPRRAAQPGRAGCLPNPSASAAANATAGSFPSRSRASAAADSRPRTAGPDNDRHGIREQLPDERREVRPAQAGAWPTAARAADPSSRRAR